MRFHELPESPGALLGVICAAAGIGITTLILSKQSTHRKLDGIPALGSSSWLGSWWAARKIESNIQESAHEGYKKYKRLPFKIAGASLWYVFVSSPQHIEELRKAPDDTLSIVAALSKTLKMEHTLGWEIMHNTYHQDVIRGQFTRSLGTLYPEMLDEISVAFEEILDSSNGWVSVPALSTIQKIVCRVSNRLFVGFPLCRDPDWIDINVRYTLDVFEAAEKIKYFNFSNYLAPAVVYFITNVPRVKKRAMRHLAPMIEDRLRLLEQYGNDWDGKPDDILSWLLKEAPEGPERSVKLLTNRVLAVNFGAIHTSSHSFSHALFLLAENPQYIQPLREEVEAIIEKEGWSKASLGKMRKIDSFMKESQRMAGITVVGLPRLAIKDFTFSDGTFIPRGTFIAAPSASLHFDDEYYKNPHVFNPFRFSDIYNGDDNEGTRHQFVSTSPEYLPFGHGKHACPGRFFAATELKSMLAHIVVKYDVKLEDNRPRPDGILSGVGRLVDPLAQIMFRRRAH